MTMIYIYIYINVCPSDVFLKGFYIGDDDI